MAAEPDDRNVSEPAAYSGEGPDRARVEDAVPSTSDAGAAMARFREILVQTGDLAWVDKTLDGLSQKMLWRDDDSGASIALVRFLKGSGVRRGHAGALQEAHEGNRRAAVVVAPQHLLRQAVQRLVDPGQVPGLHEDLAKAGHRPARDRKSVV